MIMKKRKLYLIVAFFALTAFAVSNFFQQGNALNLLGSDLSSLIKLEQAQAEDSGNNKRPLYQSTGGAYCCGNTQSTSCGAVACN